ncbi:hypothetical protein BD779DRAFT_1614400 [Infundibulicybe gibba]|nr:hypothetical protein BD779DRAFT_1614400 [Infundibulicybe gibba]
MKRLQTAKKPKTLSPAEDLSTEDQGWTKVEKKKPKKAKNAQVKLDATQPRSFRRPHAIPIDASSGVRVEIRDLVLHTVADAPPPNWLRVENAQNIQKVVAVLIPGITPELLALPPLPTSATVNPNLPIPIPLSSTSGIPFIASTFSHACPTRAPGDSTRMHSVLSSFFNGPVSGEEKKKRIAQKLISEHVRVKDPSNYLLTLEQMIENDYPIPSYMAEVSQAEDGWVETPEQPKESLLVPEPGKEPSVKQKVYAIDCEMCLTEGGKELARISIIDFHSGIVIYDQLVKPAKPVIDYLTRWSGITAEALAPVQTTLAQVQEHLLRLLSPPVPNPFSPSPSTSVPPTPILLGHSLESDLKALKLRHPLCIDTALMYHHPRGRPLKPGLAWLTKKWGGGHDPEEDARACLDLLKKKMDNPPGFGEFKTDYESIFERMGRSNRRAGGGPGSIKSAVIDHGSPSVMHGNKATTSIGCTDDEGILSGLIDVIPAHHFVFGRFMELANTLGWTTPKPSPDRPLPEPTPEPTPETLSQTLYASLPPRTALVIFTGHSDPRRMSSLNARKNIFETAIKAGKKPEEIEPEGKWSAADGRDLEEAVERARRGLLFLGMKQ